jgi:hypothetical protein
VATSNPGEFKFLKFSGSATETLTLETNSRDGDEFDYVGLGALLRTTTGDEQDTEFNSFAYGLGTQPGDVPTVGNAHFDIDVRGFLSVPGEELRRLTGFGTFDLDFGGGQFRAYSLLEETGVSSGTLRSGYLPFEALGLLSANGDFYGLFTYDNFYHVFGGPVEGRLFGPSGEEIGAGFWGDDGNGGVISGAFAGQNNANLPRSLRLDNIVSSIDLPMFFTNHFSEYNTALDPKYRGAGAYNERGDNAEENRVLVAAGQMTINPDGSLSITRYSVEESGLMTVANQVAASDSDFTAYEIDPTGPLSWDGPALIEIFKPGAANSEVQLTYAGFGRWNQTVSESTWTQRRKDYFIFGFETPKNLTASRTGVATYSGAVYATTTNNLGQFVNVGGTSKFRIDFGNQSYSGELALVRNGVPPLGTWTFSDLLYAGQFQIARLYKNGVSGPSGLTSNSILPRFYGPNGQEIAATFTITEGWPAEIGGKPISGVTVAKQD